MDSSIILIVLFFILVIGLIILGAAQARKRREQLQQWASANGWRFDAERDRSLEHTFSEFSCLRQGSNRYGYNRVMGVSNERSFLSFDYHYETESRDSKGNRTTHNHYFSAVVIESAIPLHPLLVRPEGLFDKVTEFFGVDDIDFESSEFSRQFFVKAADRKWAYDVIHTRAMEFLLSQPRFIIEFGTAQVMIYLGRTFSIEEFDKALKVVAGLLDLMPEYLVKQQEERMISGQEKREST